MYLLLKSSANFINKRILMENRLNQTEWIGQLESQQCQISTMSEKHTNMGTSEEDSRRKLEHLQRCVKTIAALLNYLKSKVRIIEIPHFAHISCGIKHQENIGLVEENNTLGTSSGNDGAVDDILKSVHIVKDVMETLVERVVTAESEARTEKEKVRLGLEEIKTKTVQIKYMSARVEEMERFVNSVFFFYLFYETFPIICMSINGDNLVDTRDLVIFQVRTC
jgi:hypothetical protein